MERLTTRNSMGVAVFKESYDCENCNESLWRLPDYGNGSPTEKLAQYEEAEEQGLFLRLPCKVGDTVYNIIPRVKEKSTYAGYVVERIVIYDNSIVLRFTNGLSKDVNQIGKTIFLTEKEAEQALRQMGE